VVGLRRVVQSGDRVAVRAGVQGVTAETQGVAAQSGEPGDIIRVVNPSSRRSVKARVVGPGKVEVVQ
jgi:flagella basal body P-ring formation protein FlgA